MFSLNSTTSSSEKTEQRANTSSQASGSGSSGPTTVASQSHFLGTGVGGAVVTQNVNTATTTDTARVMDLSKVAAAEQYVRALMSRPTTPTGEVTPLSLSILPMDRIPAPDHAPVANVNNDMNVGF